MNANQLRVDLFALAGFAALYSCKYVLPGITNASLVDSRNVGVWRLNGRAS